MRNAILNGVLILMTAAFAPPVDSNGLINIGGIIYTSSGNYFIEENEDGIFLKTNDEWVWQLQGDDLDQFKPGDTGAFFLDKFSDPPYILLDRNRTFYITNKEILNDLRSTITNHENNETLETIGIIKGNETFVRHKLMPGVYKTTEEALRGEKGEATIRWEMEKAAEQARIEAERRAKQEAKARAEAEARNRQALENLRKMVEQRQAANYKKCIQACESYKDICMSGCFVTEPAAGFCSGNCYYMEDKCKERCR